MIQRTLALPTQRIRRYALLALAVLFVAAGVNHFLNPAFYVAIMPPYLPEPKLLVYLSGFVEIVGGLGVLVGRYRAVAGWVLIALLVAVFPANLHMALHPELYPTVPAWVLYTRLPLQFVFIAWAYWATRREGVWSDFA